MYGALQLILLILEYWLSLTRPQHLNLRLKLIYQVCYFISFQSR